MSRVASRIKDWVEEFCPEPILRPYMRWRYTRIQPRHGDGTEQAFTKIYRDNWWGSGESISGPGSNLDRAREIGRALPSLIHELGVRVLLDVPCGDFNWMRHVDLGDCRYIGGDIVRDLIDRVQAEYGDDGADTSDRQPRRSFRHINLATDALPQADLLLARDCFIHLSFATIRACLSNIKRSGIPHVLLSTYPHKRHNWDIADGGFRPVNLQRPPFNLPPPLRLIREDDNPDKRSQERHLGLWRNDQLPGLPVMAAVDASTRPA